MSSAPDDAAGHLYQQAETQEADPAGDSLQGAAGSNSSNDAVEIMMDNQNRTDPSLEAFDSQVVEESTDLDSGEVQDDRPLGIALRQLVQRVRQRTEDQPDPNQDTDHDGEPDRTDDDDDDGDGVVDTDDDVPRDADFDGRNDDEPAPTRGPLDLSNLPPPSRSPELADIGRDSPVSSREMVDPRYRSSAAKNDLSLPRETAPRGRRGRGKSARREALRFNSGTGRPVR